MIQEKDSVCSWCVCCWPCAMLLSSVAIAFYPCFLCQGVIDQFFLAGDGFTCFRMDYRVCTMFDQWYVVYQLRWLCHLQMQLKIVPDLILDKIESHGVAFIILGDNLVLYLWWSLGFIWLSNRCGWRFCGHEWSIAVSVGLVDLWCHLHSVFVWGWVWCRGYRGCISSGHSCNCYIRCIFE